MLQVPKKQKKKKQLHSGNLPGHKGELTTRFILKLLAPSTLRTTEPDHVRHNRY